MTPTPAVSLLGFDMQSMADVIYFNIFWEILFDLFEFERFLNFAIYESDRSQ